jgi:hypothetical protein
MTGCIAFQYGSLTFLECIYLTKTEYINLVRIPSDVHVEDLCNTVYHLGRLKVTVHFVKKIFIYFHYLEQFSFILGLLLDSGT